MVSQPCPDGITDTAPHGITSTLTAGQIELAAGQRHIRPDPAGSSGHRTRQSIKGNDDHERADPAGRH
jgi:hypothetical protein